MAFNLVSLISQFITPEIVSRIAEALGIDRSKAQSAVTAAVPGVLAGLVSSAAQPGGAQRVADAVTQNSGIFDTVSSMLGGGNQSTIMGMGSQLMSSLFGPRDSSALGNAIGSYAGISPTQSSSLLGMLTPLVMGGIGKALGGSQPSAGGIASLLAGQKDNIMSALPSSVGSMLSGASLFSAFPGAARTAQAAGARAGAMAGDGMRAAASTVHRFGDTARRAGGGTASRFENWAYWLLPLLVLTALALWMIAGSSNRDALKHASAVSTNVFERETVSARVAGGLNVLRSALGDVNDAASARAVLPRLQMINAQLGTLKEQLPEMTPIERSELASVVSPALPGVDKAIDDALAAPGVSQELRPTLDEVRAKLNELSR